MTVTEAGSDRRALLEALRQTLAHEIDSGGHRYGCSCECGVYADRRVLTSLAKELRELIRELDSLPVAGEESTVDDLKAQREKRRKPPAATRRTPRTASS